MDDIYICEMAANGTESLVFIDDLKADITIRMNSEVNRDILFAETDRMLLHITADCR